MKIYVDFHNFDQLSRAFLRASISPSLSTHHFFWIEWEGMTCEGRPDISLIYANDLPWQEAVRISNSAPGKWVVLVGQRSPQIGLPIVDAVFKWADLPQFAGIEESADDALQLNPYPTRFSPTIPGLATQLGQLQI